MHSAARKFNVYGIGNALVDMEVEVEQEFIHANKIEKGVTTLIDEAREAEILSAINSGSANHKRTCGGSTANSLIGAAEFGGKCFYSCKVANDEAGQFYLRDLIEHGVETNLSPSTLESGVTGKCLVLITPDAERSLNTFLGVSSHFSKKEIMEEQLKDSQYLFIEGYLVATPAGRAAMLEAKRIAEANGVKVAITFSAVGMVKHFGTYFREIIGDGVDLVFCNESEAYAYTGTEDLKEAVEGIKKITKTFAITLGSKGALVYDGKEEILVPTVKVKVVDTNGAGDLFAGAMLYGITNGMSFAEAGKLGCTASSVLVTQFGPRLRQEQVDEIKKNFKA